MAKKTKKKRVAVAGLYTLPNMGDKLLCDSTEYLIRQFDPEIEIVRLDVNPRYEWQYTGFDHVKYLKSKEMKAALEVEYFEKINDRSRKRYWRERTMWRLRLFSHYRRTLKDVDAVVVAGGGFVKYRTQGLNYYMEMILEIASHRRIPVMLNGIGVEGYRGSDPRCIQLAKRLNRSCVKTVTTRDDLETLRKYITRKDIRTELVGDPALWAPDCFGITRDEKASKIGINVIRERIFKDYGNQRFGREVRAFYLGLLTALKEKGADFELFSNGMPSDQRMGERLLEELGLPKELLREAPETSEDLLNTVASYRTVFGARLHACITAFALGIPVEGLIWSEKARFFARFTDREDAFFEEDQLDPELIAERIIRGREEAPNDHSIRNDLREKTKNALYDFLSEYVTGTGAK